MNKKRVGRRITIFLTLYLITGLTLYFSFFGAYFDLFLILMIIPFWPIAFPFAICFGHYTGECKYLGIPIFPAAIVFAVLLYFIAHIIEKYFYKH